MAIPTIFLLLTSVFFLMQVLPGDPIVIMYGEQFPGSLSSETPCDPSRKRIDSQPTDGQTDPEPEKQITQGI